jgi:hypothetical protein
VRQRPALFNALLLVVLPAVAEAAGPAAARCRLDAEQPSRVWNVSFGAQDLARPIRIDAAALQTSPPRRTVAVDYSEAYKVRARIHKIASFATLPVFGAMYWAGQDLYDHPGESEAKQGFHSAMAATTGALFGVNTVTGVWNLWEGRKDPAHRRLRVAHGLLMLAADAGFVATGLLAPDDEHEGGRAGVGSSDRRRHRAVALSSMGVATVSYLLMLVGGR